MSNSNSSLKKNIKLKNITYISPSHSKSNNTNDSQRLLNTNGSRGNIIGRNIKNITNSSNLSQYGNSNNPIHKNNMINDFYRSNSSNSRSQVYSLSRNSKLGLLKKPINTSNIITTSSSTSHNTSVNSSTFNNYPYNYSNYNTGLGSSATSKRRKASSANHSSALNNNLVKSQSSSNYLGMSSKYRNIAYREFKRGEEQPSHASHENLKGNINIIGIMGVNPSPNTDSRMKVLYNGISKGIKSLSRPQRNDSNRNEIMESQERVHHRLQNSSSYYGGSDRKKNLKSESSQLKQIGQGISGVRKGSGTSTGMNQGTYSQGSCSVHDKDTMGTNLGNNLNKATISEVESPEELHFYYVNILQSGKKLQNKFDNY